MNNAEVKTFFSLLVAIIAVAFFFTRPDRKDDVETLVCTGSGPWAFKESDYVKHGTEAWERLYHPLCQGFPEGHTVSRIEIEKVEWPLPGELWIDLGNDQDQKKEGNICVWMYNAQLREWEALGGPLCPKEITR